MFAKVVAFDFSDSMIVSVRKMGRCGIIAAYAGFTNGFNIGALMEKGVRLIGNGQAPVHKYWEEIHNFIKAGKFDPTLYVCSLSDEVNLQILIF